MVPRCEFGLAAVDGCLYAFGGWVGEDIGGSIEMYDPALNEWRMQGTMQDPRWVENHKFFINYAKNN